MGPRSQAIANEGACAHTYTYMDIPLIENFLKVRGRKEILVICLPRILQRKSNNSSKSENPNNVALHYQTEQE